MEQICELSLEDLEKVNAGSFEATHSTKMRKIRSSWKYLPDVCPICQKAITGDKRNHYGYGKWMCGEIKYVCKTNQKSFYRTSGVNVDDD